jgi:transposase InsO family protein
VTERLGAVGQSELRECLAGDAGDAVALAWFAARGIKATRLMTDGAMSYRNTRALPHWLRHYNQRRPHSSLGGQPPISRAHNLAGQDS